MNFSEQKIQVEVIYALPHECYTTTLSMAVNSTVQEAIQQSDLSSYYPELNWAAAKLGIWGKIVALDRILQDGDRVEIYRPLLIDPKEARRQRILVKKAKK